ncbi:EboA domain-containing protein [Chitinophaga sp. GCM10012297]|uniref:EboA domain-containing protein n=1 Tax=Chitinophaga chungangae TaxID=2821488 RepID=A0ABS3YIP9_9BACT|nr:EboA domain-containing protein [Chitinophaga chungangae]MBO9154566.1 EboA domain-containing protein [Chitinophaga chungangae]
MGYAFNRESVSGTLYQVLLSNISEKGQHWISDKLRTWQAQRAMQAFNLAFTAAPRFLGRDAVNVTGEQAAVLLPFRLEEYTADRLFRVWWLMQLQEDDQKIYVQSIENLFHAAEMNELVALYGALPLLAFPEAWKMRTAEGIRSNIGVVLEAIMLHNPYPAQYLDEPAWNQLVMKAFFTEKPVQHIVGIDERANASLARILTDFAHERWAAGRTVHPLIWRMVAPFIHEGNFEDIKRIWFSEQHAEREAAALACAASAWQPAKDLLATRPDLQSDIAAGTLTWSTVASRVNG